MATNAKQLRGNTRWVLSLNAVLVYTFFYAPIALLVLYSFSDDQLVGLSRQLLHTDD